MPTRRPRPDPLSRRNPPMSLGEACRGRGLDALGLRCPACPLKVLCLTETRWRVPRLPRPRHMV